MRSRGADRFNHDLEAERYDDRVADEAHPIRRGYGACIRALAEDLRRGPGPCELPLLELGAGTGALTSQMPFDRRVIAIDISPKMLAIAGGKLVGRPVELVQADLLAWVTESDEPLGSVASAFALHHLESDEKRLLIDALAQRMVPGARLCIGDLGLAGADAHARARTGARAAAHADNAHHTAASAATAGPRAGAGATASVAASPAAAAGAHRRRADADGPS